MDTEPNNTTRDALLTRKMVHLALPVRWTPVGQEGRAPVEVGCTYDIHRNGARLSGSGDLNIGDLVLVERGRHKAICQVVWTADPASALSGQFSVQCLENRTPWEEELRQIEEQYQPIDETVRRSSSVTALRAEANRRRRPRFYVDGHIEVIDGMQHVAGEVEQISEFGARISAEEVLRPGTDFRLMLNVFDVSLTVKAKVKYQVQNSGMGVEFQEIRRGDRPMLRYVLSKLRARRVEDFVPVEIVSGGMATVAG